MRCWLRKDQCVMFVNKSSCSWHKVGDYPRISLNNKYERVLRRYPQGAISGVRRRFFTLSPPPPFLYYLHQLPLASTTHLERESNTLRRQPRRYTRHVYGKKKRGNLPPSLYKDSSPFFVPLAPFRFL